MMKRLVKPDYYRCESIFDQFINMPAIKLKDKLAISVIRQYPHFIKELPEQITQKLDFFSAYFEQMGKSHQPDAMTSGLVERKAYEKWIEGMAKK